MGSRNEYFPLGNFVTVSKLLRPSMPRPPHLSNADVSGLYHRIVWGFPREGAMKYLSTRVGMWGGLSYYTTVSEICQREVTVCGCISASVYLGCCNKILRTR